NAQGKGQTENCSLTETEEVDARGMGVVGKDRLTDEVGEARSTGVKLFCVDDWQIILEAHRKPGEAVRSPDERCADAEHDETRVELWRQCEEILLVAADAVEQEEQRRPFSMGYAWQALEMD